MPTSAIGIRRALHRDIDALVELDVIAHSDIQRRSFIEDSVAAAQCWVAANADDESPLIGYGVLNRTFFGRHFIVLIVVRNDARRTGVGRAILRGLVAQCGDSKVFTSTNESNAPMRALLGQCGFVESGSIDNLDDGDPELIFVHKR